MKYTQIPPPDYLSAYVQYFWILESNGVHQLPKALGPLADGCPGIIFQPSQEGTYYDGYNQPFPEVFLYGQTIKRTAIYLAGKFKIVGASLFPHTLKPVFGFNASELTDSCLDLDLLPVSAGASLSEQLLNTTSQTGQICLLSAYLFSQIRRNNIAVDTLTSFVLKQLIQTKGKIELKEVQKKLHLSERSLQRRFEQNVGISPKLYAKVCRFQASLLQMKHNQYTKLSDIAFDNGYADQSHFIRMFKEFAGFAPYQFQQQAYQLAGNFPGVII